MKLEDVRTKLRGIILSLTGLIIAFLFLRIIVDLFVANQDSGLIKFVVQVSDFFISPFRDVVKNEVPRDFEGFNELALISIGIYILLGILFSELLTALLHDNLKDIVVYFVDAFFKVIECIITLRIVLDLFQIPKNGVFLATIYGLTDWTHSVTNINFLNGRLYVGTILSLIIIVVIDIFVDSFLSNLFSSIEKRRAKVYKAVIPDQPKIFVQQAPPNVTVNVPAPVYQTTTYQPQQMQQRVYQTAPQQAQSTKYQSTNPIPLTQTSLPNAQSPQSLTQNQPPKPSSQMTVQRVGSPTVPTQNKNPLRKLFGR